MKCVILGIVVLAVSSSIDAACHEKNPGYCARNHHLCKAVGFVEKMKKLCPRTCKYCKYAFNDDVDCVESKPDYCLKNSWLCKNPIFKKHMKEACPVTCGYCDDVGGGSTGCKDKLPNYCASHYPLCTEDRFKDMMKRYCEKTCGFCTGTPTEPPPTLPPGETSAPYTGKCGIPEVKGVRVIAGTTPPRGAWPWQILLVYRGFPMCGGTLVSPEWVVTAAHCVHGRERIPSNFVVRVGEHDRTVKEGSEVDVAVAKVIKHQSYNPRTLNDDIALLKLSEPVKLNKYVQPACFPSQDPPIGGKCYITGWGKTHHPGRMTTVLQQGILPVVSNKVCYEKNWHRIYIKVTDAMICGGSGGTDRVSGCHGDSGGPFVCNINGKWELHGSVSHGSPVCKSTQTYTVFSRTNYFKDWIKNKMATE